MSAADADILATQEAGPAAIRGAALRFVGYGISVVLSVVSAAVLLRYLGVDEYGRYATIFSLMTIVSGVTEAGSANIGVRELATRPREQHTAILASLQGMRLTLTTVGCVLALLFALAAGYRDSMVLGTALAGAGLVLTVIGLTLFIPLQAELRLGTVTTLEVVRQLATVAMLLLVIALGGGIALLLGVQIPVAVVLVGACVMAVRGTWSLRARFDGVEWRRLFADSIPYAAATAIGILYSYVTIVMMSLVATDTETGLFGAAFRIFMVLAGVPSLLVASAFPVLARAGADNRQRLRYGVQRLFDMFLVLGLGTALVTAIGAPVAIDVVAGPDYAGAVDVLRIQAVALVATFMLALGAFALLSLRLHAALVLANVAGLLVSSVLTAALAPGLGAEGAAVANLVGETVLAIGYFAALWRQGDVHPTARGVPKVLLAAGLGAAAGFGLGLPALPATLLAGLVFVGVAVVVRAVPREAIDALKGFGRRPAPPSGPHTPPPSDPS